MKWFDRKSQFSSIAGKQKVSNVPEGLYDKCSNCSNLVYKKSLEENLWVCPNCGMHTRITANQRLQILMDEGTFVEDNENLCPIDLLKFEAKKKYADQIIAAHEKTNLNDAVISGSGKIQGIDVVISVMDFSYLGGSMGSVVGEKITRTMERALEENKPVLTVTATGGARMMESIISLMQMAKTSAACQKLHEKKIPYISILADPSTAGVMASFAALGDLIIAEPRCTVGFAGRRVIADTVREHLPKGFQTAEFVQEHGFVDMVVERAEMRNTLNKALTHMWINPRSRSITAEDKKILNKKKNGARTKKEATEVAV